MGDHELAELELWPVSGAEGAVLGSLSLSHHLCFIAATTVQNKINADYSRNRISINLIKCPIWKS